MAFCASFDSGMSSCSNGQEQYRNRFLNFVGNGRTLKGCQKNLYTDLRFSVALDVLRPASETQPSLVAGHTRHSIHAKYPVVAIGCWIMTHGGCPRYESAASDSAACDHDLHTTTRSYA